MVVSFSIEKLTHCLQKCNGVGVCDLRVFLSRDYEFLCHMLGLSGAAGMIFLRAILLLEKKITKLCKHCCLWCLITSDELRNPQRAAKSRKTASILQDHQKFKMSGGDLKKAKDFNNCIREHFFLSIPINKVSLKQG